MSSKLLFVPASLCGRAHFEARHAPPVDAVAMFAVASSAAGAIAPARVSNAKLAARSGSFAGSRPMHSAAVPRASAARRGRGASLVVEANLFNRLGRVIGSYANSLVSAAEDPEKILDQTVIEMQEDLVKMRQASAQVIASQKQLENKYKQAQATADDWYRRAELAMSKGDEELVREALSRRKSYQRTRTHGVEPRGAEGSCGEAHRQHAVPGGEDGGGQEQEGHAKARAASAKSNKEVQNLISGVSTSSALSAFEKMEEKVMGMEAEAEAVGCSPRPTTWRTSSRSWRAAAWTTSSL